MGMWTHYILLHTGLQQKNDVGLTSSSIKAKIKIQRVLLQSAVTSGQNKYPERSFGFFLARSHFVRAGATLSKWWLFQSFNNDEAGDCLLARSILAEDLISVPSLLDVTSLCAGMCESISNGYASSVQMLFTFSCLEV